MRLKSIVYAALLVQPEKRLAKSQGGTTLLGAKKSTLIPKVLMPCSEACVHSRLKDFFSIFDSGVLNKAHTWLLSTHMSALVVRSYERRSFSS